MSRLQENPEPCKLIVNFFWRSPEPLEAAIEELCSSHGPIESRMEPMAFKHTTYYDKEMGRGLYKTLVGFEKLVERDSLVRLKHETDAIERRLAGQAGQPDRRVVNIDPGLLLAEKFVLATGKNFPQRIYLGRGVYADLTLIWREGRFQAMPWTYTDYLEGPSLRFLDRARHRLIEQLAEARRI